MLEPTTVAATPTTPFGAFDPAGMIELTFPLGLPGFPAVDRFVLQPIAERGPFHLLHGLGAEPVDLVVVPVSVVADRIDAADLDNARRSLQIDAAALAVLLVVTLPVRDSGKPPTVNLRAPLFVDLERRIAVQAVLPQSDYPFRQPLAA